MRCAVMGVMRVSFGCGSRGGVCQAPPPRAELWHRLPPLTPWERDRLSLRSGQTRVPCLRGRTVSPPALPGRKLPHLSEGAKGAWNYEQIPNIPLQAQEKKKKRKKV